MTVTIKPVVDAKNLNGNAISVVAAAANALRDAGLRDEAKQLRATALTGDYNHVLTTCMQYVDFDFSGRTVINGVSGAEHVLPAGKYVVADPCYVLDKAIYDNLLNVDGAFDGIKPVEYADGKMVWILPTYHGDGSYVGSDGRHYGVDSGTIAIVEVGDCPTLFFQRGWQQYAQFHVPTPFTCERTDDGELVYGSFLTIHTNPTLCPECQDEMKYDQCDCCGNCSYCCTCNDDSDSDDDEEDE